MKRHASAIILLGTALAMLAVGVTHRALSGAYTRRVDVIASMPFVESDMYTVNDGAVRLNINTASEAALMLLPGIGEALASQIVAGRPYESVEDLLNISGIGQTKLDNIRPYVYCNGQ